MSGIVVGICGMPAMGTNKTLGPPYLKHMLPAYFLVLIYLLEL
jgi:hypothetical protein